MKNIALALVWLAGSATAITIAWQGASFVDAQVIEPLPATQFVLSCDPDQPSCSEDQPESGPSPSNNATPPARVDEVAAITEVLSSERPTTTRGSSSPAETVPTTTPAATGNGADDGTAPAASSPPSAASPPSATTVAPAPPPTSTSTPTPAANQNPPTTTTTTATAPTTAAPTTTSPPPTTTTTTTTLVHTRTFTLVGGTTAVSFSPTGVSVLWATANPGFQVSVEEESPGMKVKFDSEDHDSRLDVWWSSGPQWSIDEDQKD